MIIRGAQTADADAIARIYVDCWRDTYAGLIPDEVLIRMSQRRHALDWHRTIARPRHGERVIVAEDAGTVLGFGSCGASRSTDLPYGGEIYTLYVDLDHRGLGIGGALLKALFAKLAAERFDSALVWVLRDNPARFFYEALGGRLVAHRRERLWGVRLRQVAYGWQDLAQAAGGRAEHPASDPD